MLSANSGFLSLPARLQPFLRRIEASEHPYWSARSRRLSINLKHPGHTIHKVAARGESLAGTSCKKPLPGNCLYLFHLHRDLRDPGRINQLIERWIKIRMVFQLNLMGRDLRIRDQTRSGADHNPSLLVDHKTQRHPTGTFTIAAYDQGPPGAGHRPSTTARSYQRP